MLQTNLFGFLSGPFGEEWRKFGRFQTGLEGVEAGVAERVSQIKISYHKRIKIVHYLRLRNEIEFRPGMQDLI